MKELLTERQAAEYLGYVPTTLNAARSRGILGGVPGPKFIRLGKTIRYRKASLDEWIEQSPEQIKTTEAV